MFRKCIRNFRKVLCERKLRLLSKHSVLCPTVLTSDGAESCSKKPEQKKKNIKKEPIKTGVFFFFLKKNT